MLTDESTDTEPWGFFGMITEADRASAVAGEPAVLHLSWAGHRWVIPLDACPVCAAPPVLYQSWGTGPEVKGIAFSCVEGHSWPVDTTPLPRKPRLALVRRGTPPLVAWIRPCPTCGRYVRAREEGRANDDLTAVSAHCAAGHTWWEPTWYPVLRVAGYTPQGRAVFAETRHVVPNPR